MAYRFARHCGLTPLGVAATTTVILWTGERTTSQATAKVASRSLDSFARSSSSLISPLLRQKRNVFSTSTSSPPASNASAAKSPSFVDRYEAQLDSNPVRTKMVTGCFLWGIGDAVAQVVPQISANRSDEKKESSSIEYDWTRTGRAALFGFALHAPTSHLHFNFLEWLTVRANVTGLGIPVFKAFMEQFVYWSWISNSMYHGAMGAMQGKTPSEIYDRIADVLWDTQKAQWVFWIPIQLLNFQFVPVRHQLNVVLVTSIVWTALLSFWYPPEDEKDTKAIQEMEAAVEIAKGE